MGLAASIMMVYGDGLYTMSIYFMTAKVKKTAIRRRGRCWRRWRESQSACGWREDGFKWLATTNPWQSGGQVSLMEKGGPVRSR
ncbi:MAG: hypothetical protein ACLRXC_13345 [[Clostridium] leptum]